MTPAAASVVAAISIVVSGCASAEKPVPMSSVACEVMGPHMPQKVQRGDTYETKVTALHRNEAWHIACPASEPSARSGRAGERAN